MLLKQKIMTLPGKISRPRNNNELVAILGNFINRTLVLTNNYYDGKVPERGETNQNDEEVLKEIEN